jgi:UDP-galactopyranose mutase
MQNPDLLIVGAGPVGCVVAERTARLLGWKCLVIDKRNHHSGNCFDTAGPSGIRIHRYGPHYFRTNKKQIVDYLSEFTGWVPGNYIVKCSVNGALFPFPINLNTLRKFFKKDFTPESAKAFLDGKREKIDLPKNSEEFVLSRVGRELYEAFYLGYTLKQWGKHPRELDPSVCGRIPIRFNEVETYVDHKYQILPADGYSGMFGKMIDQEGIEVRLGIDYKDLRGEIRPRKATLYTGPVDEYFGFKLGKLPWRSLDFQFTEYKREFFQECGQINYPNDHDYTRSVEIKHVTRQKHPHTVVSYEFPKSAGDPYYPVPAPENRSLYEKYRVLAEEETIKNRVYFAGRLAEYTYINTDEAIEKALAVFERIIRDFHDR